MLFKIALKNMGKSIRDYAVYFFTIVIGVAIFYIFNSLESQTVMMNVSKDTREIIKMMITIMSGLSVFVSFVLAFLIIYANRFLMKRRNREFGIYLTFGMGKQKVSTILVLETLVVGIGSLAAGLAIGVAASQFMSAFVANMFDADMSKYRFIFSLSACRKTILCFVIIYAVVIIFNTVNVSRLKLIDLIYAGRKSEKLRMKNPWLCTLVFVAAAAVLANCYYRVGFHAVDISLKGMSWVIVAGMICTFLIFWSVSGLLLRVVMSMKSLYYKGLNSFVLRQLSSKINTTVFSMTIICLMLFVTICILTSAFAIKNTMTSNLNKKAPVDIEFSALMNLDRYASTQDEYSKKEIASSHRTVKQRYKDIKVDLDGYLKDSCEVYVYGSPDFTFEDFCGDKLGDVKKKYPQMITDTGEDIIKISDYNRLMKLYGRKLYTLASDEYMVIADFDNMMQLRDEVLSSGQTIEVFGSTLKPKYRKCQEGFLDISAQSLNTGIILVPDDVVQEKWIKQDCLFGNYKAVSKQEKQKLEKEIRSSSLKGKYIYASKQELADASLGLSALVTFIGLYLGIVFLMAGAAILALKELSESADNVERYRMLRKLGVENKMLNGALFKQIVIFFLCQLLLAITHSYFGMRFAVDVLSYMVQKDQMLSSTLLAAAIIAVIYGGYLVITYFSSKSIIRE